MNYKHGHCRKGSVTSEYQAWLSMIQRCRNQRKRTFRHYGGRGITVCARWQESFTAFLADMGRKPSASHSIDRIDSNGNYEPRNCRWATSIQQGRNRPAYVKLTAEKAEAIRVALNAGAIGKQLASEFGVGTATICRVRQGKSWAVTEDEIR